MYKGIPGVAKLVGVALLASLLASPGAHAEAQFKWKMATSWGGGPLMDKCLTSIVDNAERCRQITRNVLRFARQETTEKWPCDLNEAIERSVLLTGKYAKDKGGAVELRLEAPLVNPRTGEVYPELVGVIDLVTHDGRVIDLKTAARTTSAAALSLQHWLQLRVVYPLLFAAATGKPPTSVQVRQLVKTKTPQLVISNLTPAGQQDIELFYDLVAAHTTSGQAGCFPPTPGQHCSWCDYRGHCPLGRGSA